MHQVLRLAPNNVKPMPEPAVRYRIAHVRNTRWFWSVAGIWGLKQDAEVYTESEHHVKTLPEDGCWEVVSDVAAPRRPLDRAIVAQTITSYLWTQHCHEEGLKVVPRLEDVAPAESKRFMDAGWFVTNMVLSPDRFETALMALADTFCADGDGVLNILQSSPRTQRHYFELAVAGFYALQDNLKDEPADWNYRDQLCRALDGITPKEGTR